LRSLVRMVDDKFTSTDASGRRSAQRSMASTRSTSRRYRRSIIHCSRNKACCEYNQPPRGRYRRPWTVQDWQDACSARPRPRHWSHKLMPVRHEKRLLRRQRQIANLKLVIINALGFGPLSKTGYKLLSEVFGSECLSGVPLDRLTYHVYILEINGENYRLAEAKRRSLLASKTKCSSSSTEWARRPL
jgi:hypothetical protein